MRNLLLSAASIAFLSLAACQPEATVEVEKSLAEKPATEKPAADKPTKTVESLTAAATAGTENGPPSLQEAKEFLNI